MSTQTDDLIEMQRFQQELPYTALLSVCPLLALHRLLSDTICCVSAAFQPSRPPGATFNKLEIKKQRRLGNWWQILEKAPSAEGKSVTNEFANVVTLCMVQERMAFV